MTCKGKGCCRAPAQGLGGPGSLTPYMEGLPGAYGEAKLYVPAHNRHNETDVGNGAL